MRLLLVGLVAGLLVLSSQSTTSNAQTGAVLLVIDEDSIDNGLRPNFFTDTDVNDQNAEIGVRTQLPYFAANADAIITLHTGQVGDEGWFQPDPAQLPASWASAGPGTDAVANFWAAGPGLGTADGNGDREALLDKIPGVQPLRHDGLAALAGHVVCAVVYDSDVSVNYSPLEASLKGANLGVVAFQVLGTTPRKGSSLPAVQIQILNADTACADLGGGVIDDPID
jgi:hypothetical protein